MKSTLFWLIKKLVIGISSINENLPPFLEKEIKLLQGKGAGSEPVHSEIACVSSVLKSKDKNPIVLDIGANIGQYTQGILAVFPRARVYAFEPSSHARRELTRKFGGNQQVEIVPLAIGLESKSVLLYADKPGSGLSSLTKRNLTHHGLTMNYSEEVQIVTLDSWTESTGVIPNWIKMDVEGHELDVIRSGIKTLAKTEVIQFEFGGCNIDTRTFFRDFFYLFQELGFKIYRISKRGPIRIERYREEEESFTTTNYLAVNQKLSQKLD